MYSYYITLNSAQWDQFRNAKDYVQVRGPDGTPVGFIHPTKPPEPVEDIDELLRRRKSQAPCFTGQQVLDYLKALDGQ